MLRLGNVGLSSRTSLQENHTELRLGHIVIEVRFQRLVYYAIGKQKRRNTAVDAAGGQYRHATAHWDGCWLVARLKQPGGGTRFYSVWQQVDAPGWWVWRHPIAAIQRQPECIRPIALGAYWKTLLARPWSSNGTENQS